MNSFFRFEIYRTCDGNYLFLDLHHIVADGTSLAIIINDINRAYSGEKLEPEGYTSYDLALDNRDALAGDIYKNAENYYKSVFEHAGGSISFYPDKKRCGSNSRTLPQRDQIHFCAGCEGIL